MSSQHKVERFAIGVTKWIGSPASIVTHTIIFIASFVAAFAGYLEWNLMLLVLTTIVSLEAIYLSIFIQMSLNYTNQDIEEIQEDIDEIQEDVEEISEDVEEISEDVEEMSEEDESEEAEEERRNLDQARALSAIKGDLQKLMADVERLKGTK